MPAFLIGVIFILLTEEFGELDFENGKEVDEFEEAERVDDEENDKPPGLAVSARVPEGETFPEERPQNKRKNEWREGGEEIIGSIHRSVVKRIILMLSV